MLYVLVRGLAALVCKVLLTVEVKGTEFIPASGGFILASNHRSNLDPVLLAVSCPRRLNFMAKDKLFHIPLFSRLISSVGAFPVRRGTADVFAMKEAIRRIRRGGGLLLFPEGGRRPDHEGPSGDPRSGVGFLAVKLAAPVVPAYIAGSDKALPKNSKRIRRCKISVSFGQQILIERRMPYQDAAKLIMENIGHLAC